MGLNLLEYLTLVDGGSDGTRCVIESERRLKIHAGSGLEGSELFLEKPGREQTVGIILYERNLSERVFIM
jgi:hypothetical protein